MAFVSTQYETEGTFCTQSSVSFKLANHLTHSLLCFDSSLRQLMDITVGPSATELLDLNGKPNRIIRIILKVVVPKSKQVFFWRLKKTPSLPIIWF